MWVVTVNKPGYLPEDQEEPERWVSWEGARDALQEELGRTYDATAPEDVDANATSDFERASAEADKLTPGEPATIMLNGYAHTIRLRAQHREGLAVQTLNDFRDTLARLRLDAQFREQCARDLADGSDEPDRHDDADAWEKLTGHLLDAESALRRLTAPRD